MIPDTDVRKGWWINASLESPLLDHMDWDGVTGSAISSLRRFPMSSVPSSPIPT